MTIVSMGIERFAMEGPNVWLGSAPWVNVHAARMAAKGWSSAKGLASGASGFPESVLELESRAPAPSFEDGEESVGAPPSGGWDASDEGAAPPSEDPHPATNAAAESTQSHRAMHASVFGPA